MAPSRNKDKALVQSTLTSAFFGSTNQETAHARSPYFSKPNPPTSPDPTTAPSTEEPSPSSSARQNQSPASSLSSIETIKTILPANDTRRNALLAHTAAETKALLPNILKLVPSAPAHGYLYTPQNLPSLDHRYCPRFTTPSPASPASSASPSPSTPHPGTPIRVLNLDTLDAALALSTSPALSSRPSPNTTKGVKPVLILSLANAHHPGGGWLLGALAQEESLCYRTSLSFTLKRRFYPLPPRGGIYSPSVLVIRESLARAHALLDLQRPEHLSVVSVVSVAAIRDPVVVVAGMDAGQGEGDGDGSGSASGRLRERYQFRGDREVMKGKMRVVLRIAVLNGHRRVVLGALGCGAFRNPVGEVVRCWREVFGEVEFGGGWWEGVWFAVLDGVGGGAGGGGGEGGESNYDVFYRGLDGLIV